MSESVDKPETPRRRGEANSSEQASAAGDQEIRRWRQPAEWAGRDNRPGFYSITGAFIELPNSSRAGSPDQP